MSSVRDAGTRPESSERDSDSKLLLTVPEVADVLRTSVKAVYSMVERNQLPGVVRIGRRVLIKRVALLLFIDHNCTLSSQESRR
jgi:excisionase family DNA binding protein